MRQALRFLLPLLAVVGALAWGAATIVSVTTRGWFEKDLLSRGVLAVNSAHDALVRNVRSGDRRQLASLLDAIARSDRIMAAKLCSPDLATIAVSGTFPHDFGCEAVAARVRAARPSGWQWTTGDLTMALKGGLVHASAIPLLDELEPLGFVVLLHDMSFVERREEATRRFTLLAFAGVAVAASVMTVLMARFSWRRWTAEMRRLLSLVPFGPWEHHRAADALHRKEFQPLLRDVHDLVTSLAAEQSSGGGGRWSPERLRQTLTRHLGGEGVVVVANREPYVHDRSPDGSVHVRHPASGLVTSLEPVMRACSGVWVAHGSGTADRDVAGEQGRIRVPPGEESYALRRVWLTREEEKGYYYGFSNEGLWPLCHVAHTRPTFRASDWQQYKRVNRKFADAVCSEVQGIDPIVLVQDYHFALLPRMIRERLPRATVLTFWHIPWPNAEQFGICPWNRQLLEGLLGSSILGFHTQQHCNHFVDALDRYLEVRIDREKHAAVLGGQETLIRPYPISIDWPNRWLAGAPPVAECRRTIREELGLEPGALLGVGVDRLDYTKGIEERLMAVERLLERFPQYRGRFTFAQLAAPSRTEIERYRQLNESVEAIAVRVNQRFGDGRYQPIVFLRAHHEQPTIFRYYRAADVCYVSSLHDGMNLVAKEFVAARDDERGVLMLSRFTGAARELTEALLVNPYDLEEASEALALSLSMSPAEQGERMRAMRLFVSEFNVYRWAGRMLQDAARVRQQDRLTTRLAALFSATEDIAS